MAMGREEERGQGAPSPSPRLCERTSGLLRKELGLYSGCRWCAPGILTKPSDPSGKRLGRKAQAVCFSPDEIRVKLLVPGTVQ